MARFDTNWYDLVHFTNKRSNTQKWIHCTIVPGILGTNEYPGLSFSFFLVGSVGDVSRVLLACVLHALGTNPAAVRGFRNRFPKPNFEMMSARFQTSVPSFSFFLVGSVGDVSRVLLACVLHALGTNPAAVRGFRNRFPKPNFEMMSARFQTSVPGYSRIVSCDVGRPVFFPFLSF